MPQNPPLLQFRHQARFAEAPAPASRATADRASAQLPCMKPFAPFVALVPLCDPLRTLRSRQFGLIYFDSVNARREALLEPSRSGNCIEAGASNSPTATIPQNDLLYFDRFDSLGSGSGFPRSRHEILLCSLRPLRPWRERFVSATRPHCSRRIVFAPRPPGSPGGVGSAHPVQVFLCPLRFPRPWDGHPSFGPIQFDSL
jgi:hypothetical protein